MIAIAVFFGIVIGGLLALAVVNAAVRDVWRNLR